MATINKSGVRPASSSTVTISATRLAELEKAERTLLNFREHCPPLLAFPTLTELYTGFALSGFTIPDTLADDVYIFNSALRDLYPATV